MGIEGGQQGFEAGKADGVLRAEEVDGLGEKGKPSAGSSSRGARPGPGHGDDEARKGQSSRVPKATLNLELAGMETRECTGVCGEAGSAGDGCTHRTI